MKFCNDSVSKRLRGRDTGEEEEASWKIPSYRRDLRRDVDLIEEVIRAYGVGKIAGVDRSRFTPASPADRAYDFEAAIRNDLVAQGISEVRTSSLIPRRSLGGPFVEQALEVRNPLSEDHVALRPSLLPGLLMVAARNFRAGAESVRLFELGRVFEPTNGNEERHLALLFAGRADIAAHWRADAKRKLDFFDIKGAVASIGRERFSFSRTTHLDLALAAEISVGEKRIGRIGQLAMRHASRARHGTSGFCRRAESRFDRSRARSCAEISRAGKISRSHARHRDDCARIDNTRRDRVGDKKREGTAARVRRVVRSF